MYFIKPYSNLLYNYIEYFDGIEYLFSFMLLYIFLYIFMYLILRNNINFINNTPNKKLYVIKNISKSIGLFFFVIFNLGVLYDILIENIWNSHYIHRLGFVYSSSDILSLLIVRKLPTSTKIHHTSVLIFTLINSKINYEIDSCWKGLIVYTIFSCFSYLVNTYLGIRIIYNNYITDLICKNALYIYVFCCLINWSYQIFIISKWTIKLSPDVIVYSSLISMVVYDDIVLIKFFIRNVYKLN